MTILMAESISLVKFFSRITSPAYRTVMALFCAPGFDINHFQMIPSFYVRVGAFSVKLLIAFVISLLISCTSVAFSLEPESFGLFDLNKLRFFFLPLGEG